MVTSESARAYKPDPRGFLRVLHETGVSPEEAVYVGDSPLDDVHGARLVGMRAAWLNRSGAQWEPSFLAPHHEVTGLERAGAGTGIFGRGDLDMIKLDGRGLVPAVVQDADTGRVLMLGYASPGSIRRTLEEGQCVVLQPQP